MPKKQPKRPTYVTPVGEMKFGWITRPREANPEFNKGPEYTITLRFDPKVTENAKLRNFIEGEVAKSKAEAIEKAETGKEAKEIKDKYQLSGPIKVEVDDDGNETGFILFNASQPAVFKDKKTGEEKDRNMPIYDAKKNLLANSKAGSGSKVKAAFTLSPYAVKGSKLVGVKAYLQGVQIIELVEYMGGASADSLGFGEEEGFDGTQGEPETANNTEGAATDGTGF